MYSQHALSRMKSRGVRFGFLKTLLAQADRERPVGGGCCLLTVSRARAREINASDRLGRYGVIWSDRTGTIVTVLPIRQGPSGACYRHAR